MKGFVLAYNSGGLELIMAWQREWEVDEFQPHAPDLGAVSLAHDLHAILLAPVT